MESLYQPLNPLLYQRLLSRFGRVVTSHRGEEAQVFSERDVYGKMRYVFKGGEYYNVCCPFCDDTRFRLEFSYLWGHYDAAHGTSHKHLTTCFNEECVRNNPARVDKLHFEIYGLMDRQAIQQSPIRQGISTVGRVIGPPGRVISLVDLPPEHSANQYLLSRGFDYKDLAKRYGLGYCEEAAEAYPIMWHRLVLPIYQNGQYVGFQGRLLGDGRPKYYNPPGASKTDWIYNMDAARHYSVLVVTEGATKVWRIGPFAVALLGKTLSGKQPALLAEMAKQAEFVVLYLDGEAWTVAPGKNPTSSPTLPAAASTLRTLRLHVPEQKIVVIPLQAGMAPDDFSTEVNHQMIFGQLRQRGWRGEVKDLFKRSEPAISFQLPPRRV
jgi:hypothetical protein